MVKLPTVDIVDGELFAGTTFSFDMKFWLDEDKTEPNPVESFQCSIYGNGTELLDLDEFVTVDETDTNVIHVSVSPEASEDLPTVNARWQGVTTFVSGEVRPAFSGKIQIWGKKVDTEPEEEP